MPPARRGPVRTSGGTHERGPFEYRLWASGNEWRWQVTCGSIVVAEGAAGSSVGARAQALARAIRQIEECDQRDKAKPQ
jgi:hypothetical protein